jgi:hypothetical protein
MANLLEKLQRDFFFGVIGDECKFHLEIVPVGNVGDIEGLASILGCIVALLPMKYLGLPLTAPYKASTIWNGIEKMEQWLIFFLGGEGGWLLVRSLSFI